MTNRAHRQTLNKDQRCSKGEDAVQAALDRFKISSYILNKSVDVTQNKCLRDIASYNHRWE